MSLSERPSVDACIEGCTEAQREAICHTDGPLLVLAGAGSGKTRVITRRIGRLIAGGTAPHDILAITFTNKAADEMAERVRALCGPHKVWLSTFHAMCARILRHHAERAGLTASFSIYDTADTLGVIRQAVKDLDLSDETTSAPTVARAISAAKARLETPDDCTGSAETPFAKAVARVYRRYEEVLRANNAADFDDLLMKVVMLLRNDDEVRAHYQQRFRHILIDEYQDTNHAQYVIAQLLAAKHRNICATGDPDQSIYGWRGADINNILAFEKDYPDARVVRLEQNYRSTKVILRAAGALIAHNVQRKPKDLWTENPEGSLIRLLACDDDREEARAIARDIADKRRQGRCAWGDVAIFYRTNAQSRSLEMGLRDGGVPYYIVAGTSFFERKEIRDLVAYLRLCVNSADDLALERMLNVPPRGLGARSIERMKAWAAQRQVPLREALRYAEDAGLRASQADAARALDALLDALQNNLHGAVAAQVEQVLDRTSYLPYVRMNLSDGDDRCNNVQELINAAAEYDRDEPEGGLTGFLERAALVSDQDAYDAREDGVALMTLHAAKGLEFPVCYLTGLEDRLLPLGDESEGRDLEEERRLCFVGITRAKQELVLSLAAQRSRFGRREYSDPSPFLDEMGDDVVERRLFRGAAGSVRARRLRNGSSMSASTDEDGGVRVVYDGDEPPPAANPSRPVDPSADGIDAGDWVLHPTFGRGEVINVRGWGDTRTALVRFHVAGMKRIALRYRILRKLT